MSAIYSSEAEIGGGGVDDQDLKGRDASRFVDAFEKILRDDALERLSQGSADLVLLGGREDVDDTIDRFGGIGGVQSAENEVTGSGRGQRELDRVQMTHFAEENDVRSFTRCLAQRVGKGAGRGADFARLHGRIVNAVDEYR